VKRTGLAVPESGIGASNQQTASQKPGVEAGQSATAWPTKDTPKQRFGLGWFKTIVSTPS